MISAVPPDDRSADGHSTPLQMGKDGELVGDVVRRPPSLAVYPEHIVALRCRDQVMIGESARLDQLAAAGRGQIVMGPEVGDQAFYCKRRVHNRQIALHSVSLRTMSCRCFHH
jgi:hypothetical protein